MIVKVRPGDIEIDRATAIHLLRRHVNPAYDQKRFDWLYHAGPALQLQRACLDDLAADGISACYDFPSRSMEAIYRRLRIVPSIQFQRLVRPLRVSHRLRQRAGILGSAAGSVVDLALAWACRLPRLPVGLTVALHSGRCGGEFTELSRRVGAANGICGERSAEFLNWRYLESPLDRHELLTARSSGTLVGYVVVAREAEVATLVDVFSTDDSMVANALVRHAIARLWSQGIADVRMAVAASDPWLARWTRMGFRRRGEAPVVVHPLAGSEPGASALPHSAWFLTHGDRDG